MILIGDALACLKTLPNETIQTCVTSPPYWGLRDYGVSGQLGLEKTPEEYVAKIIEIFREVRRVLRKDGTLWLVLGDTYWGGKGQSGRLDHNLEQRVAQGRSLARREYTLDMDKCPQDGKHEFIKPKDLVGIPWRVAFALQADGWWLRSDIIWAKPNPMPESVTDRCTKSHEYIFLLTKSASYYYDAEAVKVEGAQNKWGKYSNPKYGKGSNGKMQSAKELTKDEYLDKYQQRNLHSVWNITTKPFRGAHFATFPPEIPEICIKAGSKESDIILDPFAGSGTTLEVAVRLDRHYIGIELNEKYVRELIEPRLAKISPLFPRARVEKENVQK